MEQQKSEELMVSLCCCIMAGWVGVVPHELPPDLSYDDVFTADTIRMLSNSSLLPTIASYLTNDSSKRRSQCD